MFNRKVQRQKRHLRLRQRIIGTAARPRMSICVTNKNIYVQFIDDDAGKTLAQANTLKDEKINIETAKALGAKAAEAAKSAIAQIACARTLKPHLTTKKIIVSGRIAAQMVAKI